MTDKEIKDIVAVGNHGFFYSVTDGYAIYIRDLGFKGDTDDYYYKLMGLNLNTALGLCLEGEGAMTEMFFGADDGDGIPPEFQLGDWIEMTTENLLQLYVNIHRDEICQMANAIPNEYVAWQFTPDMLEDTIYKLGYAPEYSYITKTEFTKIVAEDMATIPKHDNGNLGAALKDCVESYLKQLDCPRIYYAELCPDGLNLFTGQNALYRFDSEEDRDAFVANQAGDHPRACGNTLCAACRARVSRDHPRACGEH